MAGRACHVFQDAGHRVSQAGKNAGARESRGLFANVREQRHEAGPLDRSGNRVLTGGGAAALAAADDTPLSVDHFLQQFHVLVIDVHRTWSVPIDEDWVFLAGAGTNSRSLSGATASAHWARRHGGLGIEANGLYGRPLHWVVDSPERNYAGSDAQIRELEQCETKYVGEESYSQGEVGPGFALSRMENLCHISQTLRWVGIAAVRDLVCQRFCSQRVRLAATWHLRRDSSESA